MSKTIALAMRADDAEPFLREAATEAAKFGAFCDHFTRKMAFGPFDAGNYDERRKEWLAKFLRAKRIVEAFGVEYEATSEEETLTVYIPDKVLKSHVVTVAGMTFRHIDERRPDPKRSMPAWRRGIHEKACEAAADRVVQRWRETVQEAKAA